jgi:hypothetical protein
VKEIVVALKLDFHGMNTPVKEIVAAKKLPVHGMKIYVPRSREWHRQPLLTSKFRH